MTKKTSDFPGTGEAMGVPPGRAALSYMMSGTPNGNAKQKHTSGGLWTGFGFGPLDATRNKSSMVLFFCFLKIGDLKNRFGFQGIPFILRIRLGNKQSEGFTN